MPFEEKKKKNKKEEYLKGITLKYFKKACSLFKDIYLKQLDKSYLRPKLVLLYSIAFIKMYLFYYVEYNRENSNQVNFLDINDVIAADHNSTGKTIQLYTLKLLRKWKLGIGDWGLGIGDWGLGIGTNHQFPIPNSQSPNTIYKISKKHMKIS